MRALNYVCLFLYCPGLFQTPPDFFRTFSDLSGFSGFPDFSDCSENNSFHASLMNQSCICHASGTRHALRPIRAHDACMRSIRRSASTHDSCIMHGPAVRHACIMRGAFTRLCTHHPRAMHAPIPSHAPCSHASPINFHPV